MKKLIDLSEHNGKLNLQELKDKGINDVILRIAWLGNKNNHTQDSEVQNYYTQAKKLNMNVGFYVYSYCETLDALKDGIVFVDLILNSLNVPQGTTIFLDLEDEQISYLSKEDLTNQAEYFCNYMILRGFKSGIYANLDWYKNHLEVNRLLNYKIWLAYWNETEPVTSFRYDIWQYTDNLEINNKKFDANFVINEDEKESGDFEMKVYENGSTPEIVYQDAQCTKQIGYLHPYEKATCYGIVENKALIVYVIDGTNNLKSGFVKWLGGIK